MRPKFFKHKILLDENFFVPSYLPNLNKKFTVKHILQNPKRAGWSDWHVFQFASRNHMIIVTFNIKDFVDFVEFSKNTGVVGVSGNLNDEEIDKKLTALFIKSSKRTLFGKITFLSGETKKL